MIDITKTPKFKKKQGNPAILPEIHDFLAISSRQL
jgi:hypothetical protein